MTLGTLVLLLLLPLFSFLPKVQFEVSGDGGEALKMSTGTVPFLGMLWFCGFAVACLVLFRDYRALLRWFSSSEEITDPRSREVFRECHAASGIRRPVEMRLARQLASPCVAGMFKPVIYLPAGSETWSEKTLRMVVMHELGHIARRDLWIFLTARLACLVHWFNPLVWWLRRHLKAQCEYGCDALVISRGVNPREYASALCDVAESPVQPATALAMAGGAPLRTRVERLLARPGHQPRLLVAGVLLASATAAVALSVVRLAPVPFDDRGYSKEELKTRLTADPFPAE